MAGTICGSIEHFSTAPTAASSSVQDAFVSIFNFFSSTAMRNIGFERVCYNTGAVGTGMIAGPRGVNRYDSALPQGANGFAVWRSKNASLPWYILVQAACGTVCNTAPGVPCLFDNVSAVGIGFSFAMRLDGGNPWNGTAIDTPNASGSAAKGTPVWVSGSSTLVCFPRSNVTGGAHIASTQNMMLPITEAASSYRYHMMADVDNFTFLFDYGADNIYQGLIFGKYVPFTGSSTPSTYFAISTNGAGGGFLPFAVNTTYGIAAGTQPNGGICFPSASNTRTTKQLILDRYGLMTTALYHPNKTFVTMSFTEFPLTLLTNEANEQGYVGQHNEFFREVFNTPTHDTNLAGTRCAFGDASVATVKLTVPWHSGTAPGSGVTRGGVQWTLP